MFLMKTKIKQEQNEFGNKNKKIKLTKQQKGNKTIWTFF